MITLDIIGTIYTDVVVSTAWDVLSGGDPLPGFHVNTIPAIDDWEQYRVFPKTKRRMFAGIKEATACYCFPSKEVFEQIASAYLIDVVQEIDDV